MVTFEEKVNSLVDRTIGNNVWRKSKTFNLVASESETSPLVKLCEISDPAGRYGEHRTVKGKEVYYYQGTKQFIEPVEEELIRELKVFLGVSLVEPRPISGTMANRVLYEAIVRYLGRKIKLVLANELVQGGGHLSHRHSGALFQCVEVDAEGKEKLIAIPLDSRNPFKTDQNKLADIIRSDKPELIIFGRSMYLFPQPIGLARKIIDSEGLGTIIMADDAHTLGLYGLFHNPLLDAHFLTGSTHKSYFGTERGLIASGLSENHPLYKIWVHIKNRAFPGNLSNHHLGTLLGLLMATYEMNEFKDAYQRQVVNNAKAFARALKAAGIQVEGDVDGFTETHQVVINIKQYGNGIEIAERLEKNNVITSYTTIPPYDKTFEDPSGIRMGVQEMTRYGMKERDFEQLAVYVADAIKGKNVKDEVQRFRTGFVQMHYTIDPEKGAPLAARLLDSVIPDKEYAKRFADNFMRVVSTR